MRLKSYIANAILFLALACLKCEDLGGGDCGTGGFCNITVCAPGGTVDADDWQPITIGSTYTIWLNAACPNPTTGVTRFGYVMAQRDSVIITINDRPNSIVRSIASTQLDPGIYERQIDLTGLKPDIYRLYFLVIRGNATYSSYGDIKVIK